MGTDWLEDGPKEEERTRKRAAEAVPLDPPPCARSNELRYSPTSHPRPAHFALHRPTRPARVLPCLAALPTRSPAATREYREVGGRATWSVSSFKGSFGVDHLRDDNVTTYWQYVACLARWAGHRQASSCSPDPIRPGVPTQIRRRAAASGQCPVPHAGAGRCTLTPPSCPVRAPTQRPSCQVVCGGPVQRVAVYLDSRIDESYTPNKIVLRAGSTFHDLQDVGLMDLADVSGWCLIPVADAMQRCVLAPCCCLHGDGARLTAPSLPPPSHPPRLVPPALPPTLRLPSLPPTLRSFVRPVRAHILQSSVVSNLQNGRDTHIRQVKVYAPLANPLDPSARPFTSATFRQQEILR